MGLKAEYNSKTVNTGAQKETEDTQGRTKGQMEQQGANRSKTGQNLGLWVNKKHRREDQGFGKQTEKSRTYIAEKEHLYSKQLEK